MSTKSSTLSHVPSSTGALDRSGHPKFWTAILLCTKSEPITRRESPICTRWPLAPKKELLFMCTRKGSSVLRHRLGPDSAPLEKYSSSSRGRSWQSTKLSRSSGVSAPELSGCAEITLSAGH
jgi:hypothetical protein